MMNKMSKVSNQVLNIIKDNRIKPKPRWYFLTKNYLIWSLFSLSVILGSISFSMVLFITRQLDWDIYRYVGESWLKTVFISLPYFWVIFLLIFLGVAYYNFIHTRRGYRFKIFSILLSSLIISIILGSLFYARGFSESLENIFREKIPYYNKMVYTWERQWMQPERGLITGTIQEIDLSRQTDFVLIDLNNNLWKIEAANALWKGKLAPYPGLKLKIIGQIKDTNIFEAKEIRIWPGEGQRRKAKGGHP